MGELIESLSSGEEMFSRVSFRLRDEGEWGKYNREVKERKRTQNAISSALARSVQQVIMPSLLPPF